MFALALAMKIDADDDMTCTLTFHESAVAARTKIIETMLAYTAPGIKTIEDFIAEMNATRDLEGVDVDSMTPDELINWVRIEAIGDDTQLTYEIKKVPA